MFIIMKTQEFVDVRVGESTQPDHGYELSDKCIITKSSNAVASGAGSKGLFSYKSTKLYLQPIITQYFIDNKSEIWLLFLIAHSKR